MVFKFFRSKYFRGNSALSSALSIALVVIIAAIACFALWESGIGINLETSSLTSSQSTASSATSTVASVRVSIISGASQNTSSLGYSPDVITVVIGVNSTVVWTNNDIAPHTVTARNGQFDSHNLDSGQSYAFTFTQPGTYQYHCDYHYWMNGTVIVKQS